jgi:hypothetical protein
LPCSPFRIVAATQPYQGPARWAATGVGLARCGAYDTAGARRLDLLCGEQGKLLSAKAFKLAERDNNMSEQEKPKSFMQELDQWTDATVVKPLVQGVMDDLKSTDPRFWEEVVETVKKAIRTKVLESYRNGQQAGPRTAKQPQKGGR